jgi:glutamate carboxypeptidase
MNSEGTFAKNRKGSGKLTLIATGKTAHAGRAFDSGRNAIAYLAEAIVAIQALNGQHSGVTINLGQVFGGEALNVVPDKAILKMDIRISQPEDEYWVRDQLDIIFKKLNRVDYTLTLHGQFERPVKKINAATAHLFNRVKQLGEQLGLHLDWQDSGGCCDGNNFSAHGLAVIDTLGVRGGEIHSENEFILLNSLIERAALSTLLLHDLASGSLEDISSQISGD